MGRGTIRRYLTMETPMPKQSFRSNNYSCFISIVMECYNANMGKSITELPDKDLTARRQLSGIGPI